MKMKYFRFLYGETGRCFLHLGELQDTTQEEAYTFLYLRRVEKHVGQMKSGRRLFLFPEHVNLAVLGSADDESLQILRELLQSTEVDTLILSERIPPERWNRLPKVREIVRLEGGTYQTGWKDWSFLARSCADGTSAVAHGLSAGTQESGIEDCVMSVKALREGVSCQKELSPDSYGCALGCALYQDYDVCKYRESGKNPSLRTGTLLFGGGEDKAACRELLREAQDNVGEIRFMGLTAVHASEQIAALDEACAERPEALEKGFRRYLIGSDGMDAQVVAKLCRNGWYQRPVILREGDGICCSGFLKYC